MRRLALALPLLLSTPAAAQTATEALAAKWNTICASATDSGRLIYQRCQETLTSPDPNANWIAARGQRLEEIPGQVRAATRDRATLPGMVRVDFGGGAVGWMREAPGGGLSLAVEESLAAQWAWFAAADIGRLKRSASANEAAFGADTAALTAGVDWRPSDGWQLGAALNHSRERLDYRDSEGRADIRFTGLLLTGSREIGNDWLLHGYAGTLRGGYDLYREIRYRLAGQTGELAIQAAATAAPDARRQLAGTALARAWSHGGWSGSIELGHDWTRTRIDPYSEAGGGGVALNVPGRRVDTRRGRLDLSAQRGGSADWGVWQAVLGLGWRQEFGLSRRQLAVTLREDVAGNVVRFDTQDSDRGWGEWSLGGAFTFTGGHSAFLEYRQRFAHDFLSERLLALGWRVELR